MKSKNPAIPRATAWFIGISLLWLFLGLHAVMLFDETGDINQTTPVDWVFMILFGALAVYTIRSLVKRLRWVDPAGHVMRVFLNVCALLGLLSPLSMILAMFRLSIKTESPGMGPMIFLFYTFWGLIGAALCFLARFFFRTSRIQSKCFRHRKSPDHKPSQNIMQQPSIPDPGRAEPLEGYSLLQTSLNQTLPRESLEAASRAVPAICEVDCARMSQEAFGIVIRDLSPAVSIAFQRALQGQGIQTVRVPNERLFALPQGRMTRDLSWDNGRLIETDSFGRILRIRPEDCAFIAAGRIRDRVRKQERKPIKMKRIRASSGFGASQVDVFVTMEKRDVWEAATLYRIELFLLQPPIRLIWQCDPTRPARLNGRVVRVDNTDEIGAFLQTLAGWLPQKQINLGLQKQASSDARVYPSLSAFEEETIWTLSQKPTS